MLSAALCLALLAPQNPGDVVINELVYSDTGTDDREFVELYNNTNQTINLSNWVLEAWDGVLPDDNPDYTIPPGNSIAPGGFFVMGAPGVPNVNLVLGSPPHTNLWEDSNESMTLKDSNGQVIDTLVYEANKGLWIGAQFEGEPIWGNYDSIDNRETSLARIRDGRDTNNNGLDFYMMPSTPGTANGSALSVGFPYFANFNALTPESPLTEWASSFVSMHVVDPTAVSTHNPNTIPASPGGGNCVVQWDPAGGGNTTVFLGEVASSISYESWVYFDATPWSAPAEWEHFSVGFGTTCSYANTPDPGGTLASLFNPGDFDANGDTGVSWTYLKSSVIGSENILYLIDHNDGGWGPGAQSVPTILGQVSILAGVNDGWQRLRLEVSLNPTGGNYVIGSFGGTFGCADGVTFQGQVGNLGPALCYVGYRQNDGVSAYIPPSLRPFTADDILIKSASSAVSLAGAAASTNSGTPTLSVSGPPTIGNAGFTLSGSGLVPSALTTIFIGTPLGPPGFPMQTIGGQPGSQILVNVVTSIALPTNATGKFSLPLGLMCNPAFLGATISWQNFDLDLTLPFRLPFGNSRRLDTKFGN